MMDCSGGRAATCASSAYAEQGIGAEGTTPGGENPTGPEPAVCEVVLESISAESSALARLLDVSSKLPREFDELSKLPREFDELSKLARLFDELAFPGSTLHSS